MTLEELRDNKPPFAGNSFETGSTRGVDGSPLLEAYQFLKFCIHQADRANWFDAAQYCANLFGGQKYTEIMDYVFNGF